MSDQKPISRMRGLGRFVGHIWGAVSSAPPEGQDHENQAREVRRTHEQETRDGVILRRTTIEEIEIPPGAPGERATEHDA